MRQPKPTKIDDLQDRVAPLIAGAVFYMRKLQRQLVEIENVLKEFNTQQEGEVQRNDNNEICP